VGAAELFLQDLGEADFPGLLHRAFVADMGDYPSLYPAFVGAWWYTAGGGLPGRLRVRSVNLLFPLLAGLAIVFIARDAGSGPALLAGACVLHIPLVAGLSRHYMPEGALIASVALAVAAANRQRRYPTAGSALILGLSIAAGLLTKQTFLLYLLPVVWLVKWKRSLALVLPTAALALPWLFNNLGEQWQYTTASLPHGSSMGFGEHLLFYPRALFSMGLGWAWCAGVVAAGIVAWRSRYRRLVILGAGHDSPPDAGAQEVRPPAGPTAPWRRRGIGRRHWCASEAVFPGVDSSGVDQLVFPGARLQGAYTLYRVSTRMPPSVAAATRCPRSRIGSPRGSRKKTPSIPRGSLGRPRDSMFDSNHL
jgi:hypothetical protein